MGRWLMPASSYKITSFLQLAGMTGEDLVLLRELGSELGCSCSQTKNRCFHCSTLEQGDYGNLLRMKFCDGHGITADGQQILDSLKREDPHDKG